MMKKIYENPSISIATFSVENIVTDLSGKTAQEIVGGNLADQGVISGNTFTTDWEKMSAINE